MRHSFIFFICQLHDCTLSPSQSHDYLNGCCLCLLCCYPLAPSYFDKLGHENEPLCCQENAKYRASFLQLWFFNQLPLISALHPLFLFFQNVTEEKSAHCQHPVRSTPLLRSSSSLVHLYTDAFHILSVFETPSCHLDFTLPSCIFFFSSFFLCFVSFTCHPLLTLPLHFRWSLLVFHFLPFIWLSSLNG